MIYLQLYWQMIRQTDKERIKKTHKDMKKNMFIWVIALLLAANTTASAASAAQQHRHTPRTTVVDDKVKQQASADSAAAAKAASQGETTVAYSDTTSATVDEEWEDDSQPSAYSQYYRHEITDNQAFAERMFDKISESGKYLVAIIFIIFIGAPLILLLMIFYFINRNRQDKIRLAEMALKHGQPIPGTERVVYRDAQPKEETRAPQSKASFLQRSDNYTYDEDLRAKGIKHIAIGLGLMVCCLAFWNNDFIGGIGFLVACFGGGQLFMAKKEKQTERGFSKEGNDENKVCDETIQKEDNIQ